MTNKIVTLGEIMVRLSPPENKLITQCESFKVNYGGAEANTAVMLGNLGMKSYFVSQLPNNSVAESSMNYLRSHGVNTDYIVKKGKRMGLYYYEKGSSLRPSRVIYDRADSSITEADYKDFDFDEIFKGAEWFHFSGITLALGENCRKLVKEAVEAAKKNNVKISIDLNYRKQLWSYEDFLEAVTPFLRDAYLVIGWVDLDANLKDYKPYDFTSKALEEEYFIRVMKSMQDNFNIKYIATTLRENFSSSHNALCAIAYDGNKLHKSKRLEFNILDRVGAGDSFAAGMIYKLVQGSEIQEALEFANAAAAIKHTIEGDANLASGQDIMEIVNGNTSGVVKR